MKLIFITLLFLACVPTCCVAKLFGNMIQKAQFSPKINPLLGPHPGAMPPNMMMMLGNSNDRKVFPSALPPHLQQSAPVPTAMPAPNAPGSPQPLPANQPVPHPNSNGPISLDSKLLQGKRIPVPHPVPVFPERKGFSVPKFQPPHMAHGQPQPPPQMANGHPQQPPNSIGIPQQPPNKIGIPQQPLNNIGHLQQPPNNMVNGHPQPPPHFDNGHPQQPSNMVHGHPQQLSNMMQGHPQPFPFNHPKPMGKNIPMVPQIPMVQYGSGQNFVPQPMVAQPQPMVQAQPQPMVQAQPQPMLAQSQPHLPHPIPHSIEETVPTEVEEDKKKLNAEDQPPTTTERHLNTSISESYYGESEEHWRPVLSYSSEMSNQDVQNHIVLTHVNSTSHEMMASSEALPSTMALVRDPPPGTFSRRPGRLQQRQPAREGSVSKLEELKQGFYGILFGRKAPPRLPEHLRHAPPPNHFHPHPQQLPRHPHNWQSVNDGHVQAIKSGKHAEEITCEIFTNDVCLDVNDYPTEAIADVMKRERSRVMSMYADVPDLYNQGSMYGVPPEEETSYDTHHYYGKDNSHSYRDYADDGGYVCPSEVAYTRPKKGKNNNGEWKFIVNVPDFTQTIRLERCLKPLSKCSYVFSYLDSQCVQLLSMQRLLVWTPKIGPHIDILRIPTACTCHLVPTRNDSSLEQESSLINDFALDDPMSNSAEETFRSSSDLVDHSVVFASALPEEEDFTLSPNGHTWRSKDEEELRRPRPQLLGPYSKSKKPKKKSERRHSTFGRPQEIEYVTRRPDYDKANYDKVNYNYHPMEDYLKPWH